MIAKNPDKFDYFTNQERQSVKDMLKEFGPTHQGIAIVEGAIKKWGEELEKRKAAFKPVPFPEEPGNPAASSTHEEQEPNENLKDPQEEEMAGLTKTDDGFTDDIPSAEGFLSQQFQGHVNNKLPAGESAIF
jgi:hypothetical protein